MRVGLTTLALRFCLEAGGRLDVDDAMSQWHETFKPKSPMAGPSNQMHRSTHSTWTVARARGLPMGNLRARLFFVLTVIVVFVFGGQHLPL
ncbi:Uncharacterized protein TCM_016179 [Theobroma cacao]|uniref:Uncharacterized protein n=1 Tax=Theobroma cacao TaxID=3641 RepID=A0A061G4Y3_THECC|nr:Uncharacterized protein TCM_016179 [Theobroma cacao]